MSPDHRRESLSRQIQLICASSLTLRGILHEVRMGC